MAHGKPANIPERKSAAYLADPLVQLIVDRLRLPTVAVPLVVCTTITLLEVAWAAPNGYLLGQGKTVGLLDDPAYYYSTWLGGFAVWWYYAWLPGGIREMFAGLEASSVVNKTTLAAQQDWQDFLALARRRFGARLLSALAFAAALAATLLFYLPTARAIYPLAQESVVPLILINVWMVGVLYCILQIVVRQFILTGLLNRLFNRFDLYILPLHPDGAGGLAPLGNYALKSTYLIMVVGFIVVFSAFNRAYQQTGDFGSLRLTPELVPAIIAYVALSPAAFLGPLSTANRAMQKAKEGLLLALSQAFHQSYQQTYAAMLGGGQPPQDDQLKRLKDLQELHKLTEEFPVWPFNTRTLARFLGSVFAPILLAIVPGLITEFLLR